MALEFRPGYTNPQGQALLKFIEITLRIQKKNLKRAVNMVVNEKKVDLYVLLFYFVTDLKYTKENTIE